LRALKISLVSGAPVATDDKYGRLKISWKSAKKRGSFCTTKSTTCSPRIFPSGREFEDLLTDLDSAGVEILEEPKLDFEKSKEEPDDFGDLELPRKRGDKTNDPVRMYLREMGTVPLLTREGEIELAKRNERGQWAVRKALSRSPLVIREIIQLGEDLQRGVTAVRDVLVLPEFVITDEDFTGQLNDLLAQIAEIEKYYKKSQQFRQKLQAVSRQMKPKQHRGLRYGLARNMVQISRIIRNIGFSTSVRRSLAGRLRCSVDELKPLEREIAKIQRKLEEPANGHPSRDLRKELRQCGQRIQQLEEDCGASATELGARCKSSSAASRKPKPPRNSSSKPTCAWWFPSPSATPIAGCSSSI
jgi:RNA polymerase primary sigma factor